MLPAPGQAALGVQVRADDADGRSSCVAALDHAETRAAVDRRAALSVRLWAAGAARPSRALRHGRRRPAPSSARASCSLDGAQDDRGRTPTADLRHRRRRPSGAAGPSGGARPRSGRRRPRAAAVSVRAARRPPHRRHPRRGPGRRAGRGAARAGRRAAHWCRRSGATPPPTPAPLAPGRARRSSGARWVGMTSPSGVRYGLAGRSARRGPALPDGLGVAVVGPGTAEALAELGARAVFQPSQVVRRRVRGRAARRARRPRRAAPLRHRPRGHRRRPPRRAAPR